MVLLRVLHHRHSEQVRGRSPIKFTSSSRSIFIRCKQGYLVNMDEADLSSSVHWDDSEGKQAAPVSYAAAVANTDAPAQEATTSLAASMASSPTSNLPSLPLSPDTKSKPVTPAAPRPVEYAVSNRTRVQSLSDDENSDPLSSMLLEKEAVTVEDGHHLLSDDDLVQTEDTHEQVDLSASDLSQSGYFGGATSKKADPLEGSTMSATIAFNQPTAGETWQPKAYVPLEAVDAKASILVRHPEKIGDGVRDAYIQYAVLTTVPSTAPFEEAMEQLTFPY